DPQEAQLALASYVSRDPYIADDQLGTRVARRINEKPTVIDTEDQMNRHIGAQIQRAVQLNGSAQRAHVQERLAGERLLHCHVEAKDVISIGVAHVARYVVERIELIAQVIEAGDVGKTERAPT